MSAMPFELHREEPRGAGERAHPGNDVLGARAYLSAVAEPPAPALTGFVAQEGAVRTAERVRAGDVPPEVCEEVQARREHVSGQRCLERAEALGVRLLVPEHPEWPREMFSCFSDATAIGMPGLAEPLALWVRGKCALDELLHHSVAIVGARAASGYGEHLASEWGHALSSAGFTVVSGAAYGIDGAAHRGALAAQRPTVAITACGIDRDYPAGHSRLLAGIAERGLVISEHAPGVPPRKHRFLVRNRLIAGAGLGTVVVEAGARSGAANTAHTADRLGRPVMAVPGPVTAASSVGCHEMIRAGTAILVCSPDQVREAIAPFGQAPPVEAETPSRATDGLGPEARRVHDAMAPGVASGAEELARDSGMSLGKVRAVLPGLELAGFVTRQEGGWVRL